MLRRVFGPTEGNETGSGVTCGLKLCYITHTELVLINKMSDLWCCTTRVKLVSGTN